MPAVARRTMIEGRDMRILALWRDDPTEAPMSVDRARRQCADRSRPGICSAPSISTASRTRPFTFGATARIDFGAGRRSLANGLARGGDKVGASFTVWFNEADNGVYRIVKIALLGAKDRK